MLLCFTYLSVPCILSMYSTASDLVEYLAWRCIPIIRILLVGYVQRAQLRTTEFRHAFNNVVCRLWFRTYISVCIPGSFLYMLDNI
uniref:Uncharacterized protein n=1 Tax=Arundo donax TaxID=35708 RepID=A0A0A9H3L7_ARUDO